MVDAVFQFATRRKQSILVAVLAVATTLWLIGIVPFVVQQGSISYIFVFVTLVLGVVFAINCYRFLRQAYLVSVSGNGTITFHSLWNSISVDYRTIRSLRSRPFGVETIVGSFVSIEHSLGTSILPLTAQVDVMLLELARLDPASSIFQLEPFRMRWAERMKQERTEIKRSRSGWRWDDGA
jgi:hypothetical protein